MRKYVIFFLLALLTGVAGTVNAKSVDVNFDKKVILADSLNLPQNTSAYSMLTLLPELLGRPGSSFLTNYDVKVEGMSVGEVKDVALQQIHIDDIEKIEVDESPVSSYQNNGVGGSINIVLRSHGQKSDKLWGSASMVAAHPSDFTPQFIIGHRSKNFLLRGLVLGDIYDYDHGEDLNEYNAEGVFHETKHTETDETFRSQLSRIYMQYTPKKSDEIKLNLSQIYSYERNTVTQQYVDFLSLTDKSKQSSLQALLNYKHTFSNGASICGEVQYQYMPGHEESYLPRVDLYTCKIRDHNISGKIEFNTSLLSRSSKNILKMTVGCNVNAVYHRDEINSFQLENLQNIYESPKNNTHFLQPYASWEGVFGQLKVKLATEFQHFRYSLSRPNSLTEAIGGVAGDTYRFTSNDFTGKFILGWIFNKNHVLRFIADRKLNRPSEDQLFPVMIINPKNWEYQLGNPSLTPALSHELRLDYVSNYRWGEHTLMMEMGSSVNMINDIINSYTLQEDFDIYGVQGTYDCVNYENNGRSTVLNANLLALYRYKAFTMSLTGNLYHKEDKIGGAHDHYTYYTLSLYPQFRLKDGWNGAVKLVYYSKVTRDNQSIGDCATASITVGRRLGKWFIYAFNRVTLQRDAKDISYNEDGSYSVRSYTMRPNTAGVGVKFSF